MSPENQFAAAALRAAVRRLISAVGRDAVEVVVQRRDVEVLLMVLGGEKREVRLPPAPDLHPAQV